MIYCLGISHQTAPLSLRERLACRLEDVAADLSEGGPIRELVLLCTCNRIEIYADVSEKFSFPKDVLVNVLSRGSFLAPDSFVDHSFFYEDEEAMAHLLRVVSGLDSMVLGEPQILGQVTQAYMTAVSQKTSGRVLKALFKRAIRTGKRVHSETMISNNPASISSVAISLAQETLGSLAGRSILVIGAGEMGRLAVKALHNRGIDTVSVANRTVSKAEKLVVEGKGEAFGLESLREGIARAEVVISAAGTPSPLIKAAMIGERERPLVLVDIAVPRSIDCDVTQVAGVRLFDVDDLQNTLDCSLAARQAEIPKAEAIISAEKERLRAELRQQTITPVIVGMRRKAEAIRQAEMERTMRYLGDMDPETMVHLQHFSRSLINKLLHEPTLRLRQAALEEESEDYVGTVRHLFGLGRECVD